MKFINVLLREHAPFAVVFGGKHGYVRQRTVIVVRGRRSGRFDLKILNEEIRVSPFVRAMCFQPRNDRLLLSGTALVPESLRRAKSVRKLFVRLK